MTLDDLYDTLVANNFGYWNSAAFMNKALFTPNSNIQVSNADGVYVISAKTRRTAEVLEQMFEYDSDVKVILSIGENPTIVV